MGSVLGTRERGVVATPQLCGDCADEADTLFAGRLYCGRCALYRLISALRAEAGLASDEDGPAPTADEGVLVDG